MENFNPMKRAILSLLALACQRPPVAQNLML